MPKKFKHKKKPPAPLPLVSDYGEHALTFDTDVGQAITPIITVANAGGDIIGTDYFSSELGLAGKMFISWNKGVARFLLPSNFPNHNGVLRDLCTAKEIVIHPFVVNGRTFLWLIFEDRSTNPYCVWISGEAMDRNIPTKMNFKFKFSLYTEAGKKYQVPGSFAKDVQGRYRMDIFNLKDSIRRGLKPIDDITGKEARAFTIYERMSKISPDGFDEGMALSQKFHLSDSAMESVMEMMKFLGKDTARAHQYKKFMNLPFPMMWLEYTIDHNGIPLQFGAWLCEKPEDKTIGVVWYYPDSKAHQGIASGYAEMRVHRENDQFIFGRIHVSGRDEPEMTDTLFQKHASIIVSFLVLLNDKKYVVAENTRTVPKTHGVAEYRVTDISFKVPREVAIRKPYTYGGGAGGAKRMQHDVMGAWHQHRNKGLECIGHEWEHEEDSDRRMRCKHCGKLTWFVRSHQRGNPDLGIMTKDRYVH